MTSFLPRDREHLAATAAFFTHGAMLGSWAPRIPDIRHALGLSDGVLGLALLGAPVGTVAGQLWAASLVRRFGSRQVTRLSLIGACLLPILFPLAGNAAELFVVLMFWGGFVGALDLAMNASAVLTEDNRDRPIMVGLHGRWSIGALVGSLVAVAAAAAGVSVLVQEAVLGGVLLVGAWWLTGPLLDDLSANPATGGIWRHLDRTLVLLALLTAADFLSEGSVADWSAVYLRDNFGAAAAVAAAAFSVYLVAMIVTRLSGDRLTQHFGSVRVVRTLAAAALVVITAALLVGGVAWGLVGFGMLGIGVACCAPLSFAAAARAPGTSTGQGLAVVTTAGYGAYMVAPPLIGGLATVFSLPVALGILPVMLVVILYAASALRPAAR